MKRFILALLVFISTIPGWAQTQQEFPALATNNIFTAHNEFPWINNTIYSGTTLYPTLQSAVTTACAIGTNYNVEVPVGTSAGVDITTITGCATVYITDVRVAVPQYCSWGSAYTCTSGGGGSSGVTKLIAGANISLSPSNGVGEVTITATGGGGGSGCNPSGVAGTVALSDGSGGCITDASLTNNSTNHELNQKIINGTRYASQYQTTPGSGDGLANAAGSTQNRTIILDSDEPSADVPLKLVGTLPNNTTVIDQRSNGTYGSTQINADNCQASQFGADGSFSSCNQIESYYDSPAPNGGNPSYAMMIEQTVTGPGYSWGCCSTGGDPLWTSGGYGLVVNAAGYAPGIQGVVTISGNKMGEGDQNLLLVNGNSTGCGTAPSDQCLTAIAFQGGQSDVHSFFQLASTTGRGDQTFLPAPFSGTHFYQRINAGPNSFIINFGQPVGGSTGAVTWVVIPPGGGGQGMTPGTYSVSCTGGGGSGAVLSVVVDSTHSVEIIGAVTITNGGTGYTSAPTCALTSAGGTGPTLIASIGVAGTITSSVASVPGSTYLHGMQFSGTPLAVSTGDVVTSSGAAGNSATPGTYVTDTITAVINNNHPLSATTNNGIVWIAGNDVQPERGKVLSVSGGTTTGQTQTISIQHINQISVGSNIYQGGTEGCLELDANYDATDVLGCYFAFGAVSTSVEAYGWLSHGGMPNPVAGGGNMFANTTGGSNSVHILAAVNVLYTTAAEAENNAGGIAGQPHAAVNNINWTVNDWMANTEPTTWDVSGIFFANVFSNTSADNGDSIEFLQFSGMHWTNNTNVIFLNNGNNLSIYHEFGGALSEPQAIAMDGAYSSILDLQYAPDNGVINIHNNSPSGVFNLLTGIASIRVDVTDALFDFGNYGLTAQGGFTTSSYTYYGNIGALVDKQVMYATNNGSSTYTTFGDGTNYNANAIFGLKEIDIATAHVGVSPPISVFFSTFATGSGTSYGYEAVSVDAAGNHSAPSSVLSGSGPSSLSLSNFYTINWSPQPGAESTIIYRTTGPGGAGPLCTVSGRGQSCSDTGQTVTGGAPSATSASGNLFVGVNATIGGVTTSALGIGPTSSTLWTSGSGAPTGACNNGSIYTSTAGTTVNILWACGSSAWQLVQ